MAKSNFLNDIAPTDHWFAGPLRDNAKIYGQTILAALVINFLGLVSSFFIMTVYDRVLPNNAVESLVALTIGVVAAHIFDFVLKSLRGYFVDVAGQRLDASVGARLFEHLTAMRLDARKGGVGATAGLVKEFDNLRDFFSSATIVALVDLPFLFIFIGVIAFVGGPIALVPFVGVVAALAGAAAIQPLIHRHTKAAMGQGRSKHGVLIETLAGLETVKSVAAGSMMRARWRKSVNAQAKTATFGRFLNQAAVNFAGFCQQTTQVGVVVVGVLLVGANELSMGGLIACVILTGRAMSPLSQVAGLLSRVSSAFASYRSLDALMGARREKEDGKNYLRRETLSGRIEFREVSFSYLGEKARALDEVSFVIEPGERVGVLGRNGSGKSTIVRLAMGVYEPTEGQILIDDTDIRQIDPADLRSNIGAVLQDVCLFSGSIRENLTLGLENVSDADILAASKLAGAHDFIGQTDAGYDQQLGERGEGLSGGQRQAVALARAFVGDPAAVLLDEPSSALDAQAEAGLIARLRKATQGKTLLVVTHRPSILKLVDRIIVLDKGRVLVDGPRDAVIAAMNRPRRTPPANVERLPVRNARVA